MSFFSLRNRSSNSSSTLISFYDGSGHDYNGRYLKDILKWGTGKLESNHDYIQMLFPLPEESGVNWNAPVIDRQVFEAFHSRPELRGNLRKAFERMLWFYGFQLGTEGPSGKLKVVKGDNYDTNSENWDTRFDHNHLRITRIIRCLRVLGLEAEAQAFRSALEESTTRASSRSREFWRRAAQRALNLRPDMEGVDDEDTAIGPKFLREYEEKKKSKKQKDDSDALDEQAEDKEEHDKAEKGKVHGKASDPEVKNDVEAGKNEEEVSDDSSKPPAKKAKAEHKPKGPDHGVDSSG